MNLEKKHRKDKEIVLEIENHAKGNFVILSQIDNPVFSSYKLMLTSSVLAPAAQPSLGTSSVLVLYNQCLHRYHPCSMKDHKANQRFLVESYGSYLVL